MQSWVELLILNSGGCFRKKRFPNANSMKDQHECHVSCSKLKVIESNIQAWCSYLYIGDPFRFNEKRRFREAENSKVVIYN